MPRIAKSPIIAEIAAHGHVLTPGRYVGTEEVEGNGDPFEEKMQRLVDELHAQFAESAKLEQAVKANLKGLGQDPSLIGSLGFSTFSRYNLQYESWHFGYN